MSNMVCKSIEECRISLYAMMLQRSLKQKLLIRSSDTKRLPTPLIPVRGFFDTP